MATIVYCDLLGTRSVWKQEGAVGAKKTFDGFTGMIIKAARPDIEAVLDGGIETDSGVLVCDTTAAALRIVARLMRDAFSREAITNHRTWIRGAVVGWDGQPLRTVRNAFGSAANLGIWVYSPSFLDAVAVEKSGFKGMRVLVRPSLITQAIRDEFRIKIGALSLIPLRKLRYSNYPTVKHGDGLLDFLWMSTSDPEERQQFAFQMAQRLRNANSDPEEFAQAAATQVVFHEEESLYRSIRHRDQVLAERG